MGSEGKVFFHQIFEVHGWHISDINMLQGVLITHSQLIKFVANYRIMRYWDSLKKRSKCDFQWTSAYSNECIRKHIARHFSTLIWLLTWGHALGVLPLVSYIYLVSSSSCVLPFVVWKKLKKKKSRDFNTDRFPTSYLTHVWLSHVVSRLLLAVTSLMCSQIFFFSQYLIDSLNTIATGSFSLQGEVVRWWEV